MLARVVTFDGGTADGINTAVEQIRSEVAQGPPPGVKSTGITMLHDAEGGRIVFVGLFANEEDLRESEAVLEGMSPPDGAGTRASVEVYEVAVDMRM
jgi:hypothetical protein